MKKIGIIGTNSSGKSTLAYEVLWKLKLAGVSCDGVLKQDRRVCYDKALLETNELAQWVNITNQIKAEAEMGMRTDLEVLVSDRSPLDLYAYYMTTHKDNHRLKHMVIDWCLDTFDRLYVLEPLPYVYEDGRPTEEFRDKVFKNLLDLIRANSFKGIIKFEQLEGRPEWSFTRKNVANEILQMVGKETTLPDTTHITRILEVSALIGGSYARGTATPQSDLDVFVLGDMPDEDMRKAIALYYSMLLEWHHVPNEFVWNYLKDTVGFIETKHAR